MVRVADPMDGDAVTHAPMSSQFAIASGRIAHGSVAFCGRANCDSGGSGSLSARVCEFSLQSARAFHREGVETRSTTIQDGWPIPFTVERRRSDQLTSQFALAESDFDFHQSMLHARSTALHAGASDLHAFASTYACRPGVLHAGQATLQGNSSASNLVLASRHHAEEFIHAD